MENPRSPLLNAASDLKESPVVTARAYPNIALVKYWGKRNEEFNLPVAGSLSLTLDTFATTTSVTVGGERDTFTLGDKPADEVATSRVEAFLDLVRDMAGSNERAQVVSHNEAPTGAGLASSASGFAALALAASRAYGLDLDTRALSALARRGSGSAARSIIPDVAVWHAGTGTDSASSYAEPVEAPEMAMVIVTVDATKKAVSSREAMRLTAATSPFFDAWITTTEDYLQRMLAACAANDFTTIGELTEAHALRMHGLIQSTEPPIRYLQPQSIEVFDAVVDLRREGIEAYSTADAGPNVCVLVQPHDVHRVADALAEVVGADKVRAVGSGPGAFLVD